MPKSPKRKSKVPDQVSKPAIQRMCHRANVKTINGELYDAVRNVLDEKIKRVTEGAVVMAKNSKRVVVMPEDVIMALEEQGIKLSFSKKLKDSKPLRCKNEE